MRILSNVQTDESVHVATLECSMGEKGIIWVSDLHGDNPKSNFAFFEK